jgi:hypothetical protein
MLDEITLSLGLPEQHRVPLTDHELPDDEADVEGLLRSTDALDPRLWLRRVSFETPEESFRPALVAAMMVEDDPDLWVLVVMFAVSCDVEAHVLQAVLAQARAFCGDVFYDRLWAESELQDEDGREVLRHLAADAYLEPPHVTGTTVRWVNTSASLGDPWIVDEVQL